MSKRGNKQQVTVQIKPDVWLRFSLMTRERGISINLGLERVLMRAISENEIPGIESATEAHEKRENEKYGPATPTFDGSKEPQRQLDEKPKHVRRTG
jgi:hypothetical protein